MSARTDNEAADWLARRQTELSAAERTEFERWLDADPAHAVAFARVEFAWERTERLRALPEAALTAPPGAPQHRLRRWHWATAATLLILTVGALSWLWIAQRNIYTTNIGERRTVALSDGSYVDLNTSSRIEVSFEDHLRVVRLLKGEASFKVAPVAGRPFVVWVDGAEVRAVGTAFNVRLHSQVVEVTVTEGKVRFDPRGSTHVLSTSVDSGAGASTKEVPGDSAQEAAAVLLPAGATAVAAAGAVKLVPLPEDVIRRRIAWREGIIELKGETLAQAVDEFNRYSKSQLVVADPAVASMRVGGRFQTDEADKFVRALEANFSIRAVAGPGGNTYLMGAE